jgi:large subunit ribosomal protein L25
MPDKQKNQLHVSKRTIVGKRVSQVRLAGDIPANVFGEDHASQALSMRKKDTVRYLQAEGESGLLYLVDEDKKETPVLIDEIQTDPVSSQPIHISFKRVNLKEKVQSEVPVEMVGEADIPNATIFLVKDMLEVEALPTDLPESIVLDISGLTEIGQALHLADAKYDRAAVQVLLTEEELEEPLVIVQELKEEVEEVPADEAEGEATEDGAAADGEAADSSDNSFEKSE